MTKTDLDGTLAQNHQLQSVRLGSDPRTECTTFTQQRTHTHTQGGKHLPVAPACFRNSLIDECSEQVTHTAVVLESSVKQVNSHRMCLRRVRAPWGRKGHQDTIMTCVV